MLGIVDRYFLLEVSKAFAAIMGILMLIAVSMLFLRTLEEVNVGTLGTDLVARFVGLQILPNTPTVSPIDAAQFAPLRNIARQPPRTGRQSSQRSGD